MKYTINKADIKAAYDALKAYKAGNTSRWSETCIIASVLKRRHTGMEDVQVQRAYVQHKNTEYPLDEGGINIITEFDKIDIVAHLPNSLLREWCQRFYGRTFEVDL